MPFIEFHIVLVVVEIKFQALETISFTKLTAGLVIVFILFHTVVNVFDILFHTVVVVDFILFHILDIVVFILFHISIHLAFTVSQF